jgi:hypothetical protein
MKYLIANFTAGEVSPQALGRIDVENYPNSCRRIENAVVLPTGGVEKIPGTLYVGPADSTGAAVLIPWELTPESGALLELNANNIKVWINDAVVQTLSYPSGNAYAAADVPAVRAAITNRRGWLTHAGYEVNQIDYDASSGVFSIAKAAYTYTADSATNPLNLDFAANPPRCAALYDERLIFANTEANGKHDRYYGSVVNGYVGASLNFSNPDPDGDESNEAFEKVLHAKKRNEILWLAAEQALLLGTSYGVWRVGGPEVFLGTSTGGFPRLQGGVGAADIDAEMLDDLVVFVDRSGRRIHAVQYIEDMNKYTTSELTFWAEHIAGEGIVQLAYQQAPIRGLWVVRSDGTLAFFSYNRATGLHAWSRVDLGGKVKSLAVLPAAGGEEVYFLIERTIDGAAVRYIEKLAPWQWDRLSDAVYLHCAHRYDGGSPLIVTAVTAGDSGTSTPAQVSCSTDLDGTNLANDEYVRFAGTGEALLDGRVYRVKNLSAASDTFDLYYQDGTSPVYLDAPLSGLTEASCSRVTNTITGLSHLEGESLSGLFDGGVVPEATVSGGTAVFSEFGNAIVVGLPYTVTVEPADMRAGAGRRKRVISLYMSFYKTFSCSIGPDAERQNEVIFTQEMSFGEPPELYTGDLLQSFPGTFEFEGRIRVEQHTPLPFTLLSIVAEVEAGS